jgi:DNA-binding CsgD family transcriptional regulator
MPGKARLRGGEQRDAAAVADRGRVAASTAAARGGTYISPEVSEAVVQAYQNKAEIPPDPLSPRERQVSQLIAEGKTTKELATALDISVKTAETYRTRIMEKLDIHETASLVRYAVRRGMIQPLAGARSGTRQCLHPLWERSGTAPFSRNVVFPLLDITEVRDPPRSSPFWAE